MTIFLVGSAAGIAEDEESIVKGNVFSFLAPLSLLASRAPLFPFLASSPRMTPVTVSD